MSFYKNKTVLVTGGTGFIGTNFVKELSQHNVKIIVPIHKRTLNFQSNKIEILKKLKENNGSRPQRFKNAIDKQINEQKNKRTN